MIRRLFVAVAVGVCLPMSVAAQESVEYYGTDAIGSVRIVFDANGNILGRLDYGPFGEQLSASTVGNKSYAGLFRDGEVGLDYAEARMYQSRTGRLNAPDPVYSGLFVPQGWNRYAYALNNPLRFVDTTGLNPDDGYCLEFPEACRDPGDGNLPPRSPGDPDDCGTAPRHIEPCGGGGGGQGPGGQNPPQNPPENPPPAGPPRPPAPPPPPPQPPGVLTRIARIVKGLIPTCGKTQESPVWFVSGGGAFVPLLGFELSGGVYYSTTGEFGFFGSRPNRPSVGIALGADVQVGRVNKLSNFKGDAVSINAGYSAFSGSLTMTSDMSRYTGWAAGIPPWGQLWGAHASGTTTTLLPVCR
jgi:RHS repeat-associated protein